MNERNDKMLNITEGKTYHSFTELAKDIGLKPVNKRTKNKEKLESQRSKFLGKCPHCGQPLTHITNTNVLVCGNENCKGKKREYTNKDGEKIVKYDPYAKVLYDKSATIAHALFD